MRPGGGDGVTSPRDQPEGGEVWCESCQTEHDRLAMCVYGRNQLPTEKPEPFVLDLASNPHERLLREAAYYRSIKYDSVECMVLWHGVLIAMCAATGLPPADFDAWIDAHPEVAPAPSPVAEEISEQQVWIR